MNFKDRGNKKWNSLMLVEHQNRLKKLKLKEKEEPKPLLDQQELAEINFQIKKALKEDLIIKLKFYQDKQIKISRGKIIKINQYQKQLKFKESTAVVKKISFDQILEINSDYL